MSVKRFGLTVDMFESLVRNTCAKEANNMSLRNIEELPEAYLMNGEKHEIKIGQDPYVIGRNHTSSLLIEEPYISRVHCLIYYTRSNVFTLADNHTISGTFLNNEILPIGNSLILNHENLIGFGLKKELFLIFQFVLNKDKKIELYDDHTIIEDLKKEAAQYKTVVESFTSAMSKFKLDKTMFEEQVNLKLAECETKLEKLSSYNEELKSMKTMLNKFKHEIVRHLEDNFRCSICDKVVFKAAIGDCPHLFCEYCISTWLERSHLCPVCCKIISSTSNCLAIDNYIEDAYELEIFHQHTRKRINALDSNAELSQDFSV